ncbi:MAG: flagellar basal body rod protein FlgC [Alphaproteobacteria bacterium]|nr:flagellar basal body rod protein FlgC [Alphaproteobacteria bacterium]MCD8519818.1 flagellar basal body rod protein FlgC [Alphaproteobacteria bacterium]MCD8570282.1 flagellar basal body rod protein FlgC [Alphaproteobacteria bacterium]
MGSELLDSMVISASGMRAQGTRIRVISENIANADTAATTPGGDAYRRQLISFKNVMDRQMDLKTVKVDEISEDEKTPFILKYLPDHPGADADGYVKMPNINPLVEMMDVREAQRSYEANLTMIEQARGMVNRTIDVLRN